MITKIKTILRTVLLLPLHIFNKLSIFYSKFVNLIDPNGSECYWEELSQKQIDNRIGSSLKFRHEEYKPKIFDRSKNLKFYAPTKIASFRAYTLFSKEKDTLEWIEKHGEKNKIFYDVGANMGVYSLFYAATHKSKVYSFEPSFRNLDLLVRNIGLNNLNNYISVVSNPVFNKEIFNNFSQARNIAGLAEATFGKEQIIQDKEQNHYFSRFKENSNYYSTLGISLDHLVESNIIEKPNLIKVDVDGNEIEVLQGSKKIIKSDTCKSILIETRSETSQTIKRILEESGFKRDFDFENKDPTKTNDWNEIWLRG